MADNTEKDKKDNSFMMKLATLIVDKRKGFYLIFIVLCVFCVLSMNRVKVNNDLTTYLPDTTETRRGLDLMDSEFTTYGSARILICNVTFDEAQKLADQVEEMDGVSMLDFDDTEDHYHDMEALLSVTFDEEADTEATQQHLDEDEFVEVESYTIEELKDMVLTQKIQDSKTVAAIMAYYGKYCI